MAWEGRDVAHPAGTGRFPERLPEDTAAHAFHAGKRPSAATAGDAGTGPSLLPFPIRTPPLLILGSALAMLRWTWGTWPDIMVDFGQQLYLPWQITEGRTLYADLAYYNGPFSQYLNALAFHLFGVGLETLVWVNLAWTVLLVLLLHQAYNRLGGRLSAVTACVVFLLLFAFGRYVGIGNYNYLCPYTHEMTHGLILSLASMVCLWHVRRLGPLAGGGAGGLLLGLAFLTKAEVFLAGAVGSLVSLSLLFAGPGGNRARDRRTAAWFLAGLLFPPLVSFLLLSLRMPAEQALRATLGSWTAVANRDLAALPFFRRGMGMAEWRGNLLLMLSWAGAYGGGDPLARPGGPGLPGVPPARGPRGRPHRPHAGRHPLDLSGKNPLARRGPGASPRPGRGRIGRCGAILPGPWRTRG